MCNKYNYFEIQIKFFMFGLAKNKLSIMKKYICVLGLTIMLISCAQSKNETTATVTNQDEK